MNNEDNDSDVCGDDFSEEMDRKNFTFPKVTPLYSRSSSSAGPKTSRRIFLKKLRPFHVLKEDWSGTENSLENYPNCKVSDNDSRRSISSHFFHKSENPADGITRTRNDNVERLFPTREDNRDNLKTTPFSNSISLVTRVPKISLTTGFGKDEEQIQLSVHDSRETKDDNEMNSKNYYPVGEKVDSVYSDFGLKNTGVLKDINVNSNFKPHYDPEKFLRNEFLTLGDCLNDGVKSKKHYDGMYVCADKQISSIKRSQKSLFHDKNVENVSENLLKLRLNNGMLPRELIVNNVRYTVLSKLGQGGSSQVYMVFDDKANPLAIKCVNFVDADDATAKGYFEEVKILSELQRSNRVIKLIDHEYDRQQQLLYVVMEKGDTDLSTLLKLMAKTGDVTLPMIIYYWTEMLLAVKEIHDHGIVHADLKPANFLLVRGRLKLIDFGIASAIQNDATSVYKSTMHGTCNYMSPEAITDPGDSSRTKVGYKSDVWSLGCILYNLLYCKTPFQHIGNNLKKMQIISSCTYRIEFLPVDKCPPPLMDALKSCLMYDSKKRPSVGELLSISYIWPTD